MSIPVRKRAGNAGRTTTRRRRRSSRKGRSQCSGDASQRMTGQGRREETVWERGKSSDQLSRWFCDRLETKGSGERPSPFLAPTPLSPNVLCFNGDLWRPVILQQARLDRESLLVGRAVGRLGLPVSVVLCLVRRHIAVLIERQPALSSQPD